jgi:acyl dehydratase
MASLSVTMRLMVRSAMFGGGPIVGVGIDRLRFLKPLRAGNVLRGKAEVLEARTSTSHQDRGYLTVRITTLNEIAPVLTQDRTLMVPRRVA